MKLMHLRLKLFWQIIFLVVINRAVFAQTSSIAITNFNAEDFEKSVAKIVTGKIVSILSSSEKFNILERQQMDEILKEQGFQQTGCVSNSCVVEVGQLLGVGSIVTGSLGKVGNVIAANMRMFDVATGKVSYSVSHECNCTIEEFLKNHVEKLCEKFLSKNSNKDIPKKRNGKKAFKNIRRIVFGAAAAGLVTSALLVNNKMKNKMDKNEKIKSQYDIDETNENYDKYRKEYKENWDNAKALEKQRMIFFIGAAVTGVGFVVSIPF